ncbi:B12-binding domain-containing radical SAM protein [Abyssisolibacter fermentans]|uniref:B12-binding domain-containing radical SAM protein n=1 Tax=Abyssisolibacter fermentans TaxID=1766203 RepID=UPI00082F61F0|nr:radical SAM protein [Abyssisolibacter fermentans]
MDVLFIIPNTDRPNLQKRGLCPPIGLGSLCTVLKNNNYTSKIIDMYAKPCTKSQLIKQIKDISPKFISLSIMFSESKRVAIDIANEVKTQFPNIPILIGGVDVTFRGIMYLKECESMDYGMTYDGEITIIELLKALNNNKDISEIEGLIYREGNNIIRNNDRKPVDINSLPTIDRSFFELDYYEYPYTMMTSRGCPYSCIFCGGGAVSRGYHIKSLSKIEDEIKSIAQIIKARGDADDHHLIFWDDAFSVDSDRVIDIGKLAYKYGLKWGGQCRVNELSLEHLSDMKKYNCQKLNFGVESGDERVLENIKKSISLEDVIRIAKYCSEIKLAASFNFLLPHPSDTEDSINKTLEFASKLNELDYISISINLLTPFPGTYMYEKRYELGIRFLTDDEAYFHFRNPVFETKNLDMNTIKKYTAKALLLESKSKQDKKRLNIKY